LVPTGLIVILLAGLLLLSQACHPSFTPMRTGPPAPRDGEPALALLVESPVPGGVPAPTSATTPAQQPDKYPVAGGPSTPATRGETAVTSSADLRPAMQVYRGRTDTNAAALTFDAGADAGYAGFILDTLERNGIHASFGMTGQWAVANPDLVRRMAADGDQLLNHTWDHRSMTGLSTATRPLTRQERASELQSTDDALLRLTGQTTLPYFRAPFGDQDSSVDTDAGLLGYRYDILWTVDTGGWAGAPVARIVAASARGASPGAIVVMHVGSESQDGPALQGVIDAIKERGLRFATIDELISGP